jgi:hypothetical protein
MHITENGTQNFTRKLKIIIGLAFYLLDRILQWSECNASTNPLNPKGILYMTA